MLTDRETTRRPIQIGPGRVETIHIAAAAGAPMQPVLRIGARAGVGLDGDRYALRVGQYSNDPGTGRAMTLIEAEVLEDLASTGIVLQPGETRRNVTTRGIRLNDLVGRRFRVGSVECLGMRLCEPCDYMQGLVGKPVMKPLVHRAGLRADVITGGEFAVGDPIVVLAG